MPTPKNQIISALHAIEEEIRKLQDAAKQLKDVLKILGADNEATECAPSAVVSQPSQTTQDGISLIIDKYLDSLNDGETFLVGDAISLVCAEGYECNDSLRGNVSSVLSRRVKAGIINRVGLRGSFVKPMKVTAEKTEESRVRTVQPFPVIQVGNSEDTAVASVAPPERPFSYSRLSSPQAGDQGNQNF